MVRFSLLEADARLSEAVKCSIGIPLLELRGVGVLES
jgi:hypothetical protein